MKILFTGGGTAGHVNPALAVAGYIKSVQPEADIRFAGAQGAIEERLVKRAGYPLYTFPLAGLSRKLNFQGLRKNADALAKAMKASLMEKRRKRFRLTWCWGPADMPVIRRWAPLCGWVSAAPCWRSTPPPAWW